ncbi:hypothetical protein RLV_5957 [Rhizobium leguminosarum bv. viciae]|jgi:hypothetical protein|nr:hypothetical protein RLV_5957 [Rhizobium leguminosarum bv. viciae]
MEDRLMLSSMHILSLKQGKLYGDRIPIEALPQGFGAFPRKGSKLPRHLVVLFSLIGRWRKRTKKGPAEAGPEVAEPQQAASVA